MKEQYTLREMRKKVMGMTQAQFAAEMGISRRTLVRFEQGTAPVATLRLAGYIAKERLRETRSKSPKATHQSPPCEPAAPA